MVTKPTRDSGTIIDHVYASPTLNIEIDVNDCYYSDQDSVLCCINNKLVTTTANHAENMELVVFLKNRTYF